MYFISDKKSPDLANLQAHIFCTPFYPVFCQNHSYRSGHCGLPSVSGNERDQVTLRTLSDTIILAAYILLVSD